MISDEQLRHLRDMLPPGKDRELLTAGLVPGDCPMCGAEGDEPCTPEWKRHAHLHPMKRRHSVRVQLAKVRKAARDRAEQILALIK